MIELLEASGSVLVQDLGRPGLAHLGVSPSGAADRTALVTGNRLLGNPDGAAGLEVMGAAVLRAGADLRLAVTGAAAAVTVDGAAVDGPVLAVAAGSRVALTAPRWGIRTYVTVAGGVDAAVVLGSRSTDVLSGVGPAPLVPGAVVPVGPVAVTAVPAGLLAVARPGVGVMLDVSPGPRADWAADADELYRRPWRVSALADRVGTRLEGEPLARRRVEELASEGVVTGSVQLPPSGLPVILGPDHPVTGGYPVIAVLTAAACDALAQLRAGTVVRFRRRAPDA